MIIQAGQKLESKFPGFTVTDLMKILKWDEHERFYLQNTMSRLTRTGMSIKLGPQKPVVYSFKNASKGLEPDKAAPRKLAGKGAAQAFAGRQQITVEDAAKMDLTPELAGQGVLYLIDQLKAQNSALKDKVEDAQSWTKTKLEAQNVTIKEQADKIKEQDATIKELTATIEAQKQTIAVLQRNQKVLTKLKYTPVIEKKRTAVAKAR
ncbi:MAG: hypothetical protein M0036_14200 [Desulfobacteraceae bacterium]|nr:hypothetical protein [Desulfobacteraceae bacterium]